MSTSPDDGVPTRPDPDRRRLRDCADGSSHWGLRRSLDAFCTPSDGRALAEIAVTVGPLLALWIAMFTLARTSLPLALALAPATTAFLVRTFLIQHDCGHGSFFRTRRLNDWVGRTVGVLTITPYEYWRRGHALHHAHSGNLSRRGFWDVPLLTRREYAAQGPIARLGYRLVRHPLLLFTLSPFYLFVIQQRVPFGLMRQGWKPWASTIGNTLCVGGAGFAIGQAAGFVTLLVVVMPVFAMTASVGVWLFYIQHNFEATRFVRGEEWDFTETALHGSSHYVLPRPLAWITANIGIHHLHHLQSRIPFYRLPDALRANPGLVPELRLLPGFRSARLRLWDEDSGRLLPFLPPSDGTTFRSRTGAGLAATGGYPRADA